MLERTKPNQIQTTYFAQKIYNYCKHFFGMIDVIISQQSFVQYKQNLKGCVLFCNVIRQNGHMKETILALFPLSQSSVLCVIRFHRTCYSLLCPTSLNWNWKICSLFPSILTETLSFVIIHTKLSMFYSRHNILLWKTNTYEGKVND